MKNLRSLLRHEAGSIMPAAAAVIIAMIAAVGIAVDMGRLHLVETRLQTSLDAAGLAAGATTNGTSVTTVVTNYMNVNYPANYMGSTVGAPTVTTASSGMVINLTATATMNTTFLSILGINTLSTTAYSQITKQNSGLELVLVLDNTGSMACLVNGTSCTSGPDSKIKQVIAAINGSGALLDTIYGAGNDTVPNLWVGVVPFTDLVNINNTTYGTAFSSWMNTSYDNGLDFGPALSGSTCPSYTGATVTYSGSGTSSRCIYTMSSTAQPSFSLTNAANNLFPSGDSTAWTGCLLARSGNDGSGTAYDITDDPPSNSTTASLFEYFLYPSTAGAASSSNTCSGGGNPWNCSLATTTQNCTGSGRSRTCTNTTTTATTYYTDTSYSLGPNGGCIATPILPMTASKASVESLVSTMTANGSTMINVGLVWGWRMLSPNWKGYWGGLMNNTGNSNYPELPLDYNTPLMSKVLVLMTDGENSTGTPSAYQNQTLPSNSTLNTKTTDVCTSMKNAGITIYTIGFGDSSDVDTSLLSSCATPNTSTATYYFLAPTNAQLASAFQTIASQLSNLRVSQ